jgi:hypothetical protein
MTSKSWQNSGNLPAPKLYAGRGRKSKGPWEEFTMTISRPPSRWKRNLVLFVGLVAACSSKSKDEGASASSTTSPVPEDETASEKEQEHRAQQRALIEKMRAGGILLPDYNTPEPDPAQVKADRDAAMADAKNREDFGDAIPTDLPIVDSQRYKAAGQSSLFLDDASPVASGTDTATATVTETDDEVADPDPCVTTTTTTTTTTDGGDKPNSETVGVTLSATTAEVECPPAADDDEGGGGDDAADDEDDDDDKDCPVVCATAAAYASAFACAYAEAWACVWTVEPFVQACSYFRSSACTSAFSSVVTTACSDGTVIVSGEGGVTINAGGGGGVGVEAKSKAH